MSTELTGSQFKFGDNTTLGGVPFSYVRYMGTSNATCPAGSWTDVWNTGNFLIPAGAHFRVLIYFPSRQDGGQWGGHYCRFYWQVDDSGTWNQLGHSGYGAGDNSMSHRPPSPGQGRISHYENDFMFDFTDRTTPFNIRFLFQSQGHTTTCYANNSNGYSAGDSNSLATGGDTFRQKICIWGTGNRS